MFNVTTSISRETVASLLASVIESGYTYGCGYWARAYHSFSRRPDVPIDFSDCGVFDDRETWYIHWPLFEGGFITFIEFGDDFDVDEAVSKGTRHKLDMNAIERGLRVMKDKYPDHFADILRDEIDGPLGDLFLQCCFFGEEKYA